MTPFLKQVAKKYLAERDISSVCFIFPNRRAMAFFRKYLGECIAGQTAAKPIISPAMLTESDFFHQAAGVTTTDRITLLLELYDCYKALNPKAEPLDEFIFWGDVILADFNDIDKYLVDARQLFTNVADFKQMQDTYSYLTESQRNAIENFVRHFNDASGRLTVDLGSGNPDVKARFLQIWNILYPLYAGYNETLSRKGLAYEGMVYRAVAEQLGKEPAADIMKRMYPKARKFVFVGMNALNECEKTLMRRLRDAGLAEFCWDYSGDMIRDPRNRSSFFMQKNIEEFPQAGEWDTDGVKTPQINVMSVPSSVGQVKMLSKIFPEREWTDGDQYGDCAVVIPDENLLMPLLGSIPDYIKDINITMGYPMSGSGFYSLMSDIAALQLHAVSRGGEWHFYHRQVWSIFSGSVLRKIADGQTEKIMGEIRSNAKYYIPMEDFAGSPVLEMIFRPVALDLKSSDAGQIRAICDYQMKIISTIAPMLAEDSDMMLEMEFAREYYRSLNKLRQINLEVMPATYFRLVAQLVGGVSVPFQGEPLKGFQIMGPLETRCLDFRNIAVLSMNEGVFPSRNVSSSFIPPELRRGFDLPTYEYQDAVWAYYFYRMISRAENVWLLCDSRTEGMKSGEESRYIRQLQYHFKVPMTRYVASADISRQKEQDSIPKTKEDLEELAKMSFSASSLKNYLTCPAKFYYHSIRHLEDEGEVRESIDAGMLGTVYHDTMFSLYCGEETMASVQDFDKLSTREKPRPMEWISADYLRGWLQREDDIRKRVRSLICCKLKSMEVSGRDLVVMDVITRYVMGTIRRDLDLAEKSSRNGFEIRGLEMSLSCKFAGRTIYGYLDRLDSIAEDVVRVVDYKTGAVSDVEKGEISGDRAEAVADLVFGETADRPEILLQMFIYDMLIREQGLDRGQTIHNCVYSLSDMFSGSLMETRLNERFYEAMSKRLERLLDEIFDPEVPFRRTANRDAGCKYCDFKTICGR